MDIKFENDLKNNIMKMTVSVQKRKIVSEEKIRLKWMHVEPFLQDYKCPPTHTLGRCLNPVQTVDNDVEDQCTVTWTFFLEQKVKKISKKEVSRKKPTSKTSKKVKKTSGK